MERKSILKRLSFLFIIFLFFPYSCNQDNKDWRMSKRFTNKGFKATKKGNFELAKINFDKAIQLEEDLYPLYEYRGIMYGLLGNFDSMAIDLSHETLFSFNESDNFDDRLTFCKKNFLIGSLYYYLRNDEKAIFHLKLSLKYNPIKIGYYFESIEEKYDINLEPDFSYGRMYKETMVLCNKIYFDAGDIYKSLYYCFKLIEEFPLDLSGYFLLKKSLFELGDSLSYNKYLKELTYLKELEMSLIESADARFQGLGEILYGHKNDSIINKMVMEGYNEDMNDLFYGLDETIKNKYPRFNLDSLNEVIGK